MQKIFSVVAACAVCGALAFGCDNGENEDPDPIMVGTITSLTGDLSSLGPGWRDAAALAVQEANAAGGLLGGRQLELLVEDDRTTPDGATAAATSLVDSDVVGIIGAPASGSSIAAVAVTGPAHVPQISGTSTSPNLNTGDPDDHPYFFRTVPADDLQGFVLGGAAFGEYNDDDLNLTCTQLAIINIDNDYGNPFGDAIASRFTALGGTVVVDIDYAEGMTTYAEDVDDLIGASPDCIALVAYTDTGAIIVREWYSQGGDAVFWIGTDGVRDSEYMDDIPEDARNGFFGTAPASDSTRPQLRNFTDLFSSTFGEDPQVFGDAIYDGSALLVLAIAEAGSDDGDAIRDALLSVSAPPGEAYGPGELVTAISAIQQGIDVNYEGAVGQVDFLENGDVVADYEVWMYDGSDFQSLAAVTARDIQEGMGD